MSKVFRALTFVDRDGLVAAVHGHDRIVVDGVPFARVADRLEPLSLRSGDWHETREAALLAGAEKLTNMATEMLLKAEAMREEANGV